MLTKIYISLYPMWKVHKGEIVYYWNLSNPQDSNEDHYVPCEIGLNHLSEIRPTIGTLIRLDIEGQTQVHKIESIEYSKNRWPKYLTSVYYIKDNDAVAEDTKNTMNSDEYISLQKTKLNDLQVKIDLAMSKTKQG